MVRIIIENVKQDIFSTYFLLSVLLVLGICLVSPGMGALDYDYVSRPMMFEELTQYTEEEYLSFREIYNYYGLFLTGIGGFLYMVLPLLAMSSLKRYCEEYATGFRTQKIIRTGRKKETVGNLIASSLVGVMSLLAGLMLFMLFVVARLPQEKFDLQLFLPHLFSLCVVTVLGTMLSILIASVTKNRFYSFVIPMLLFYAENEFALGLGGAFTDASVQGLMHPWKGIMAPCFAALCLLVFYEMIERIERGRHGIGM